MTGNISADELPGENRSSPDVTELINIAAAISLCEGLGRYVLSNYCRLNVYCSATRWIVFKGRLRLYVDRCFLRGSKQSDLSSS